MSSPGTQGSRFPSLSGSPGSVPSIHPCHQYLALINPHATEWDHHGARLQQGFSGHPHMPGTVLGQWFSTRDNFVPQRQLAMSVDILGLSPPGNKWGGATGLESVEARDAAQHPIVPGSYDAPQQRNTRNVNSAEDGKPYSRS